MSSARLQSARAPGTIPASWAGVGVRTRRCGGGYDGLRAVWEAALAIVDRRAGPGAVADRRMRIVRQAGNALVQRTAKPTGFAPFTRGIWSQAHAIMVP